jgi:enterobacterial common antigen flippase
MKKIVFAFVATGVMQLTNFTSGVLLARMLGPQMRGEVAQIIAWYGFIVPILLFGINDSVTFFRSQDRAQGAVALSSAFLLSLPLSAVSAVLCVGVIFTALAGSSGSAIAAAWLFLLYAPFYHWQQIFYSYFQSGANAFTWTIVRVVPGVVYIGGLLLIAQFGTADTASVITANITGLGVTILLCMGLFWLARDPVHMPSSSMAARVFSFGLPVVAQRIAIVCRDNLDRMVLPFFVSVSALGQYVVAGSVAYLIYVVGMTVDLVGFPAMARAKDDEARRRIAEFFISTTLLVLVVTVIVFTLIREPVVLLLFGEDYAASIALVPWFLIAGAAQALRIVVSGAFKAFDLGGPMARFEFVGAVIMAAILFGGSAAFGVFAGALAHIVSALAALIIALVASVRVLKLSPRHMLLPRRSELARVWADLRRTARPSPNTQGGTP